MYRGYVRVGNNTIVFIILSCEIVVTALINLLKSNSEWADLLVVGLLLVFFFFGMAEVDWYFGQFLWFGFLLLQGLLKKNLKMEYYN